MLVRGVGYYRIELRRGVGVVVVFAAYPGRYSAIQFAACSSFVVPRSSFVLRPSSFVLPSPSSFVLPSPSSFALRPSSFDIVGRRSWDDVRGTTFVGRRSWDDVRGRVDVWTCGRLPFLLRRCCSATTAFGGVIDYIMNFVCGRKLLTEFVHLSQRGMAL